MPRDYLVVRRCSREAGQSKTEKLNPLACVGKQWQLRAVLTHKSLQVVSTVICCIGNAAARRKSLRLSAITKITWLRQSCSVPDFLEYCSCGAMTLWNMSSHAPNRQSLQKGEYCYTVINENSDRQPANSKLWSRDFFFFFLAEDRATQKYFIKGVQA